MAREHPVPNFGERLTWIRQHLVHDDSERNFARTLGLASETTIGGWRTFNPVTKAVKTPNLDTVVHIWDRLAAMLPANVNIHLLWFVTGRGPELEQALPPATLSQAIQERQTTPSVRDAAIAFWKHTHAILDQKSWSILLDKWMTLEGEGLRMAEASPTGGSEAGVISSSYDARDAAKAQATPKRAKKLPPRKR